MEEKTTLTANQMGIINRFKAMAKTSSQKFSDWEVEFAANIITRFDKFQSHTLISDNQWDKIHSMLEQYGKGSSGVSCPKSKPDKDEVENLIIEIGDLVRKRLSTEKE